MLTNRGRLVARRFESFQRDFNEAVAAREVMQIASMDVESLEFMN